MMPRLTALKVSLALNRAPSSYSWSWRRPLVRSSRVSLRRSRLSLKELLDAGQWDWTRHLMVSWADAAGANTVEAASATAVVVSASFLRNWDRTFMLNPYLLFCGCLLNKTFI